MNICYKFTVLICTAGALVGCATFEGSTTRNAVTETTATSGASLPQPTVGFKATDQLQHSQVKVYAVAVTALDAMRVPVLSSNQVEGKITNNYAAGPQSSTAFGLMGSNSSRYKYLGTVKGTGRSSKLTVTAFIESSGNTVQSWRDVSADNPTATANVRDALIENIEKLLK